jgi:outer membrane protein OmpA-like peptidoglycan-associated protein
MQHILRSLVFAAVLGAAIAPGSGQAQSIFDRAKRKLQDRVEQRADQALDRAVDEAEDAIVCAATDQVCIDNAKATGRRVEIDDTAATGAAPSGGVAVGTGAWLNYDFVPGEETLFYDDYSGDEVGNFPRRLEFEGGNMEVAEWQGARYLRASDGGEFAIPLPEVLPARFTVEMDVYHGARRHGWGYVTIRFVERPSPANSVVRVNWTSGGLLGPREAISQVGQEKFKDAFVPIRIMADGAYVKVYMGDKRVANVPNADLGRADRIWVSVPATDDSPAYVGAIRVAAGGKKLYDALAASGRVATHGILFTSGSAALRGESTPTLEEIGEMLEAHPDLALVIEGHTDNTGAAEANQALSRQRAEAVRAYLVSTFAIDESRLEAQGFGASRPVASNDTAEGRQQNRRVELVRR